MESSNSKKQIKIGAVISYITIFVNILSALIYSPWMLKEIGDGDYGLYSLASALINMFLIDFGISSAVSRFVSKYVAEGKQEKVDQLLGIVYKIFFGISSLVCVVLFVVYFFIDKIYASLTPVEIERFKVVYIISALYSVLSFPLTATVNGVLTSYEKFIHIKLCDLANKVITVLLIVVALLCGLGLYSMVTINAALNMVCLLTKWIIIKKVTPVKVNIKYWDKDLLKEVFGFSIWVLINSLCSRLIMNVCPNILGITSGTFAITVFSFASVIEGYSYTFSSAIDGFFMPRIARITYKENDMNKILPLMTKVGRFQFHLVGLIVVGFIVLGKDFISLWIGDEYSSVYLCAVLLLLPAPFYLSQQIGKNTMVMVNKVRYLTIVNIVKALVNVVLVSLLSIKHGALGACVSICVVYFFRNIANMYLFKKILGLKIEKFFVDCYAKMGFSMIIVIVVGVFIRKFIPTTGWMMFFVKVVAIVMIYLIIMWLIAYNEDEKDMVRKFVGRFKSHEQKND